MKSDCCNAKCFVMGTETKYYVCEECDQACDVKFESIAERFKEAFSYLPNAEEGETIENTDCDAMMRVSYITEWLERQPENSKTFTIEEVEQIVISAYKHGYSNKLSWDIGVDTTSLFNEFWAEKKKEMGVCKK